MIFGKSYLKICIFLIVVIISFSCDNELQEFPTINYVPCSQENFITNNNIINDFECQANIQLSNVEVIRNPKEIQVNKSKFVGSFIKIDDVGIPIDITNINLTNNAIFRIKVSTVVEDSSLSMKLEGGDSGTIELSESLISDGGWTEYRFDLSEFAFENHNKFTIFFFSNSSSQEFLIDDLSFEAFADPCANISEDLSIINDFDCQQNINIPNVTKVVNSYSSDSNSSTFIGQYIDETATSDSFIIDYQNAIDLSINNIFTLDVYTTLASSFKVKLKGGTSPEVELEQQITTTGEWVEYEFNFFNQSDANHTEIEVIFNDGVTTTNPSEYFLDNIRFTENPCAGIIFNASYFNDFDCQLNITPEGNVVSEIVENVELTNENSSANVLKITDNGREPFDFLLFDNGSAIDLSVNNSLKIKVFTSKEIPILAKLEGGTVPAKEVISNINTVDGWKEYTFDFSSETSADHQQLLLFFNVGQNDGTSLDTYYIDDVRFEEPASSQLDCTGIIADISIINDAECQQNYAIQGNVSSQILANPNTSGSNTSDFVIEVSDNGTEAFDFLLFTKGDVIDLSVRNILKIKVLTSKAVPIIAKLEGGSSTPFEITSTIDIVDQWTEYTFDFSSQSSENHQSLLFFFNAGQTNGFNPDTYFIDEIKWVQ
jgi:hypothetical protein